MITKTRSYATSDGRTHATINEAQAHAFRLALCDENGAMSPTVEKAIGTIVSEPEKFIAILKVREPRKRGPKTKTKSPAKLKADKPASVSA